MEHAAGQLHFAPGGYTAPLGVAPADDAFHLEQAFMTEAVLRARASSLEVSEAIRLQGAALQFLQALRSSTELELLASAVGPVATRPVPEADAADRGEDDEAGEIERRLGVARTILGAKWSELATIMPSDFLASMSERLRAIYSARLEEHRQGEAQPTRAPGVDAAVQTEPQAVTQAEERGHSDRDSDADGPPSESPSQSGATAALAAHLQRGIATLSSANAALAQFQSFMRGELQQLSSQADTAHQLSTQARSRALALSAATPALAMGRAPPVSPIPQPDFSQAAMDMDALLFGTAPSHVDAGHGSPAGGGAEEQGLTSDKKEAQAWESRMRAAQEAERKAMQAREEAERRLAELRAAAEATERREQRALDGLTEEWQGVTSRIAASAIELEYLHGELEALRAQVRDEQEQLERLRAGRAAQGEHSVDDPGERVPRVVTGVQALPGGPSDVQMQIGGGHAREVGDAPRETTSVGVQALPMGDRSAASEDEGEEGRARAMEDVLAARRELQVVLERRREAEEAALSAEMEAAEVVGHARELERHLAALQGRLDEGEARVRALQEERECEEEALGKVRDDVQNQRDQLQALREEVREAQRAEAAAREAQAEALRSAAEAESRLAAAELAYQGLEEDGAEGDGAGGLSSGELEALRRERQTLAEEVAELRAQAADARLSLRDSEQERAAAASTARDLRARIAALQEQVDARVAALRRVQALEATRASGAREAAATEAESARAAEEEEVGRLREEVERWAEEVRRAHEALAEAERAREAAEAAAAESASRADEAAQAAGALRAAVASREAEVSEMAVRLEDLGRQVRAMEGSTMRTDATTQAEPLRKDAAVAAVQTAAAGDAMAWPARVDASVQASRGSEEAPQGLERADQDGSREAALESELRNLQGTVLELLGVAGSRTLLVGEREVAEGARAGEGGGKGRYIGAGEALASESRGDASDGDQEGQGASIPWARLEEAVAGLSRHPSDGRTRPGAGNGSGEALSTGERAGGATERRERVGGGRPEAGVPPWRGDHASFRSFVMTEAAEDTLGIEDVDWALAGEARGDAAPEAVAGVAAWGQRLRQVRAVALEARDAVEDGVRRADRMGRRIGRRMGGPGAARVHRGDTGAAAESPLQGSSPAKDQILGLLGALERAVARMAERGEGLLASTVSAVRKDVRRLLEDRDALAGRVTGLDARCRALTRRLSDLEPAVLKIPDAAVVPLASPSSPSPPSLGSTPIGGGLAYTQGAVPAALPPPMGDAGGLSVEAWLGAALEELAVRAKREGLTRNERRVLRLQVLLHAREAQIRDLRSRLHAVESSAARS